MRIWFGKHFRRGSYRDPGAVGHDALLDHHLRSPPPDFHRALRVSGTAPEGRPAYRGFHRFDLTTCIACDACAGLPGQLHLHRQAADRGRKGFQITSFTIDYGKCLFCALCIDPCPVDCIFMGWSHDLSCYSREGCAGRFFPAAGGDCLGPGDARSAGGGQLEGGPPTGPWRPERMTASDTKQKPSGRGKLYTVAEANASLPLVRAIVGDLVELSRDVTDRRHRLSLLRAGHRPPRPLSGRTGPDRRGVAEGRRRLREYVDELRDLGIEPTNGSEGLVDFPALVDGRKVFLCWKLGEPEVRYWHEPDAGYRQRHPLRLDSNRGVKWRGWAWSESPLARPPWERCPDEGRERT